MRSIECQTGNRLKKSYVKVNEDLLLAGGKGIEHDRLYSPCMMHDRKEDDYVKTPDSEYWKMDVSLAVRTNLAVSHHF